MREGTQRCADEKEQGTEMEARSGNLQRPSGNRCRWTDRTDRNKQTGRLPSLPLHTHPTCIHIFSTIPTWLGCAEPFAHRCCTAHDPLNFGAPSLLQAFGLCLLLWRRAEEQHVLIFPLLFKTVILNVWSFSCDLHRFFVFGTWGTAVCELVCHVFPSIRPDFQTHRTRSVQKLVRRHTRPFADMHVVAFCTCSLGHRVFHPLTRIV